MQEEQFPDQPNSRAGPLSASHRPNGPAELRPGLRPQADALGQQAPQSGGLKGRGNLNRELSRLR